MAENRKHNFIWWLKIGNTTLLQGSPFLQLNHYYIFPKWQILMFPFYYSSLFIQSRLPHWLIFVLIWTPFIIPFNLKNNLLLEELDQLSDELKSNLVKAREIGAASWQESWILTRYAVFKVTPLQLQVFG